MNEQQIAAFRRRRRGLIPFFKYNPSVAVGSLGGTFTRATIADYVSGPTSLLVTQAASGEIRNSHYAYNPSSLLYYRSTLLEGARTNLCVQSEDLTSATGGWSLGTVTATAAVGTYAGLSFTRYAGLVGGLSYGFRAVTLTGDGTKAFSIFVKTDGVDGFADALLYDVTATTNRLQLRYTIASGVVTGSIIAGNGTLLNTVPLANGVYRFECISTSVTAANTHRIYTLSDGTVGTLTSVLLAGVQVED